MNSRKLKSYINKRLKHSRLKNRIKILDVKSDHHTSKYDITVHFLDWYFIDLEFINMSGQDKMIENILRFFRSLSDGAYISEIRGNRIHIGLHNNF